MESVEPPQQFFLQNLAFKNQVGDTTIAGENFAIIQFERFYKDNTIFEKNILFEHISNKKYVLTDRALNKIHAFEFNQDSTIDGYIFGWKGTVFRKPKNENTGNNKVVADYYLMRDTTELVTFNEYLFNVESYQRGVNFTRLLVGNFSSDFVNSKQENRTFQAQSNLKPGDEFETTFYEWVFEPKLMDFIKEPRSIFQCKYQKDSIVDDVKMSSLLLSSINLGTKFTEVKPELQVYELDTCWYLTSSQLVSKNKQLTYAWLRNMNEKADSVSKQNPYNLDDTFDGQFIVLNYVNIEKLNGEEFTSNRFFKSNQPGLFAQYDFLPLPFLVPPTFETQLSYLKMGNTIKGEKFKINHTGTEPYISNFNIQSKKVSIEIYLPENANIDIIVSPFEGNKKVKFIPSTQSFNKGMVKLDLNLEELENQSYYYLYCTIKFGNKTRLLHHLFQANLNN